MATWVGLIATTNARADFWDVVAPLGVQGSGPVPARVLIDCGGRFGDVQNLGRDLARVLDAETIAFAVQTTSDVHVIWVHRGSALVRTLEYVRDDGGWQKREGDVQPWEAAYFATCHHDEDEDDDDDDDDDAGPWPSSTVHMIAVCEELGVNPQTAGATYRPRGGLLSRLFGR
jgi:hypothetical protein